MLQSLNASTPSFNTRAFARHGLLWTWLLGIGFTAMSQPKRLYDLPHQRFFAKYLTSFVFGIYRGRIDEDSAAVIACSEEHIPHSLIYDELFDMGTALPATSLIDQGRISDAMATLRRLQGSDRIRLLLHLSNYYIYKPGITKSDADSAALFAQQAVQQSSTLHDNDLLYASYLTLGKLYSELGDTATCSRYMDQVVNARRTHGPEKDLGLALFSRSNAAPYFHPSRISDYNEAIRIFHSIKDTIDEILAQNKLFTIYFVQGMYDTVKAELYHTMSLEKSMGLRELHYNYTVIAYIDGMQGRDDEALIASTEAIRIMDEVSDTAFAGIFYSKMGDLMLYYRDLNECLKWFKKAMAKRTTSVTRLWYDGFIELGFVMLTLQKPEDCISFVDSITRIYPPLNAWEIMCINEILGSCYMNSGKLKNAAAHLYTAVTAANTLLSFPENYYEIGETYLEYAEMFVRQHALDSAGYYLQKASQLSRGSRALSTSKYYEALYKLDSAKGNTASAWENYRKMLYLNDSASDTDKARQLEEFRVKFHMAENEKDMKLLQNQNALQETQLEQAALTRKVGLAGVLMLILLLTLLYNRFRLKQKQQLENAEKNRVLNGLVQEKDQLLDEKDALIFEKEWLIKEIHHRVKNNLQMVVSLLTAQSAHLNNKEALQAIRESEQRMQAMSLIHQKLYQSDNMELIEMSTYIRELTGYLNAHGQTNEKLRFILQLEPVQLDVAQAVPLGLILNEAITNAIKYAFPDNRQGAVAISLRHMPEHTLELSIADNGIGLPEHIDPERTQSLGLTLMTGLSQQLKGTLQLVNRNGLHVILRFPLSPFTPPAP